MHFLIEIYFKILFFFCINYNFVLCKENDDDYEIDSSFRIVGGEESPKPYPYLVSIHMYDHHYCGGTLIDPLWVVTAAHCLFIKRAGSISELEPDNCKIVIGALDLSKKHTEPNVIIRYCEAFHKHPQYRAVAINYIAMILLDEPVDGTFIPIPNSRDVNRVLRSYKPTYCKVMGWGKTSFSEKFKRYGNKLREIEIKLISTKKCSEKFSNGIISLTGHICGLEEGKDACQGDSGGPMVCKDELYGIVSFGLDCGTDKPGVYVRVDTYASWIQHVIDKSSTLHCNNHLLLIYIILHVIC